MTIPYNKRAPLIIPQFSPELLVSQLKVSHPLGTVRVTGKVLEARPWPKDGPTKHIYAVLGSLEGAIQKLNVRLPPACVIESDDVVSIIGALDFQNDPQKGIKLMLIGDVDGREPVVNPTRSKLRRSRVQTSLVSFARVGGFAHTRILATDKGEKDFTKAVQTEAGFNVKLPTFEPISNRDKVLECMRRWVGDAGCHGVIILRGGGNDLRDLWSHDDEVCAVIASFAKPIFTAIGHADDRQLADELSDESFSTPTALGTLFGKEIAFAAREKELLAKQSADALLVAKKTDDEKIYRQQVAELRQQNSLSESRISSLSTELANARKRLMVTQSAPTVTPATSPARPVGKAWQQLPDYAIIIAVLIGAAFAYWFTH